MNYFEISILIIIGVFIFLITWRISNFFLSRKDFYVNSPYKLLKVKLKMAATAALTPAIAYVFLIRPANEEVKKSEIEQNNISIVIYPTPNIKSYPIDINYKEQLYILDSTKYFYKVTLNKPNSSIGYVLINSYKVYYRNRFLQ